MSISPHVSFTDATNVLILFIHQLKYMTKGTLAFAPNCILCDNTHFHMHVTLNVHNLCCYEYILASDVVLVGTPGLCDCIQFMKALGCPRDFVMAGCVDGLTVHSQNALFSDILSVLL